MVSFGKCFFLMLLCLALLMSPKYVEARAAFLPIGACSEFADCNKECMKRNHFGGTCTVYYPPANKYSEDACCFQRLLKIVTFDIAAFRRMVKNLTSSHSSFLPD
ncbi:hypothetical protein AALP_AA6G326800 [Arabis alpina]|uniref:Knottin scorpion toxin-like domain-containing protein n=1 Tax=Arabis alpina TaxID=50452 RepID=A0A087GT71_ARAAL|nr:hypothetical protein AALP_AA6G326800 [Arabis alpina]